MAASNMLQFSSFRRRFEAAKARAMDLSKCTTPATKELLVNYGSAVGCPPEYLFLPLLTTCASFMGANSRVQINDTWAEPAILWTVVVARKGEKKSAALKPLLSAVEAIEADMCKRWQEDDSPVEGTLYCLHTCMALIASLF